MRVLLTGGSGFLGVHCLEALLKHGHEVITTVRSPEKGEALLRKFKGKPLSYKIVDDIAKPGAFDDVVKTNPPLNAVIHTASPYHYEPKDNKKDMIDPAVNGTVGILEAIQRGAPEVEKVVLTSSVAAISNPKGHPDIYTEKVWNPVTEEEGIAATDKRTVYMASKKLAEKAAWDFVEREKPSWTLSVMNPTMIYGPVSQPDVTISSLNTSSVRIWRLYKGEARAAAVSSLFVDVRDVAEAHALALKVAGAANQRFLLVAGVDATEKGVVDVIKKHFPESARTLHPDTLSDDKPAYKVDTTRSTQVLGLKYRSLDDTIVDAVKSFTALES